MRPQLKVIKPSRKFQLRLAENKDGLVISDLVKGAGFAFNGIDWNDVYPYWILAEKDNEIVGCVQICDSRPIGRIEMLAVKENIHHLERALIVQDLSICAASTLKIRGSQYASMHVSFEMKGFRKILIKRGCVTASNGALLYKRL